MSMALSSTFAALLPPFSYDGWRLLILSVAMSLITTKDAVPFIKADPLPKKHSPSRK